MIPCVVASDSGWWLNRLRVIPVRGCVAGVVGSCVTGLTAGRRHACVSGSGLEWPAVDGESPVRESVRVLVASVPE